MKAKHYWFLGFTAVFAVLAGFVFWGTWSMDFAPVMPDDTGLVPQTYCEVVSTWWRNFLSGGRIQPTDVLWSGLLVSPYFCKELKFAVALYLAALGLAWFLRGRGLSRLSGYGAGLLLAFCGYWCTLFSAGHGGWFVWMSYGVFAFGLVDRAVRQGYFWQWVILGACVAWGCFYQSDLWLLFMVLTGAYFIWCCIRERKFPWKGMLIAAVSMFLIGGAAFRSALVNDLAGRDKQIEEGQTVSEKDKATVDEREKRWIFVTNWSLPPAETAEFVIPRLNGDTSCPMTLSLGARYGTGVKPYTGALGRPKDAPAGNYRQHSLYVGFVTCLLALAGIIMGLLVRERGSGLPTACKRSAKSDILFFLVAALLCWLFSMGRYCEPVYRVIFSLPFGDYLRAPVKWHHLTEFCICVLAGYGIECLRGLEVWKVWKVEKFAPWIVGIVVIVGAIDLARVDHLYCAPVDLREAKRQNASLQMTFLRRADFNNPHVAAMVQQKKIVALAQPNPEMYLVGVLQPRDPQKDQPWPPMDVQTWLGILSACGMLAAGIVALGWRRVQC